MTTYAKVIHGQAPFKTLRRLKVEVLDKANGYVKVSYLKPISWHTATGLSGTKYVAVNVGWLPENMVEGLES